MTNLARAIWFEAYFYTYWPITHGVGFHRPYAYQLLSQGWVRHARKRAYGYAP